MKKPQGLQYTIPVGNLDFTINHAESIVSEGDMVYRFSTRVDMISFLDDFYSYLSSQPNAPELTSTFVMPKLLKGREIVSPSELGKLEGAVSIIFLAKDIQLVQNYLNS